MSYSGTVRCGHCWETGHNKRGCPERKKYIEENPDSRAAYLVNQQKAKKRRCGWCGESGHNTRTCQHKVGAKNKIEELKPLLETHVGHVLSLAGVGRGALIRKTDWEDNQLIGVVVGASVRPGRFYHPQTVVHHSEPSITVQWHDGRRETVWTPRSGFKESLPLAKVLGETSLHAMRDWGYSSTELLSASNAPIVVEAECPVEKGQTVDTLDEWIKVLTESVKNCEDYKKSAEKA